MARKKTTSSGPNNGYLVSFGDTMTALLAFFIVLNSLAKEQTGANLHSGTGSYKDSSESFGLPGIFQRHQSKQSFQLLESAPQYIVGSNTEVDPHENDLGPDDEADFGRIIDRDQEQFIRFLIELRRTERIQSSSAKEREFSIDIMGQFPSQVSPLSEKYRTAAVQIAPLTLRAEYFIEITVWATTPSESAMTRAVQNAHALRRSIIDSMRLDQEAANRLSCSGRPWMFSDVKRPACSITVIKTSTQ